MAGTASKSKLTLWVDTETKRFGKEWAKLHHASLSHVVSAYLMRLRIVGQSAPATPLVRKLSGALKGHRGSRQAYRSYLEKKYRA